MKERITQTKPAITKQVTNRDKTIKLLQSVSLSNIPVNIGPRQSNLDELIQCFGSSKGQLKIFISGNPASGKTVVISRLLEYLQQKNQKVCYINCAELAQVDQAFKLLYLHLSKSSKNISAASALRELEKPSFAKQKLILLLDEVDYLARQNDNVLFALLELLQKYQNAQVVFVANSLSFTENYEKSGSRLQGFRQIQFCDYTAQQLVEVFDLRVPNWEDYFMSKQVVQMIAARVKTQMGDLRMFLHYCGQIYQMYHAKCENQKVSMQEVNSFLKSQRTLEPKDLSDAQILILKLLSAHSDQYVPYSEIVQYLSAKDARCFELMDLDIQQMVDNNIISVNDERQYKCEASQQRIDVEFSKRMEEGRF